MSIFRLTRVKQVTYLEQIAQATKDIHKAFASMDKTFAEINKKIEEMRSCQ